jgi:two-component system invasion response regulator UvrY
MCTAALEEGPVEGLTERHGAHAAPVRALIVDDQAPFRDAARAVLSRVAEFELVGAATSGEDAISLVDELLPALVLMDINMGAVDGIEATRAIVARHPGTFVVLVSTYTEADLPPAARTCGAAAYLNKDELSPRALRSLWAAGGDPAWHRPEG